MKKGDLSWRKTMQLSWKLYLHYLHLHEDITIADMLHLDLLKDESMS